MRAATKAVGVLLVATLVQLACSLSPVLSRRDWCRGLLVGSGGAVVGVVTGDSQDGLVVPPSALAITGETGGELPLSLRDYTKLAPLGSSSVSYPKTTNLPLSEMARRLTMDLTEGSTGQGGYIISGDISTDLFRDDCVFVDPTNRVASLSQYQKALTILFDKDRSVIELVGPLTVHEDDNTIRGKFRSRGFLKLPWNPYVSAYESEIIYKIDSNSDGLIYEQEQKWSKSSYEALRESFTPTIFTPPPVSHLPKPANEPLAATALFQKLNGRRPGEYSSEEQTEIRQLMDELVLQRAPWNAQLFPGTWKLVYFEPGEQGGGGVDRRIPFPDFSFNDQYQVFGTDRSIQNIGELWGPSLAVRVLGSYQEEDPTTQTSPKRLQANITGGKLCWNSSSSSEKYETGGGTSCVDLPIQGMGLFESLFLGERIRVLQNLNGTGARGIQVKMV